MKMILMGTGTSHGIPCIACDCDVCKSKDRRDKRNRCSAFVINKNRDKSESHVLIDCGPEFRLQALKYKIKKIDAVLLTHSHADHLHGLDDLRIFSHTISEGHLKNPNIGKETEGKGLSIYLNRQSYDDIKVRFDYVFKETQLGGGKPKLNFVHSKELDEQNASEFGDMRVLPVPMMHGRLKTCGWLFTVTSRKDKKPHSIAYLTDCSEIKEKSIQKIIDNAGILDHLVIDGLRKESHATHFSFCEALEVAEKLSPVHTWFIHMCHANSHVQIQEYVKEVLQRFPNLQKIVENGGSVEPAYDGLKIQTL